MADENQPSYIIVTDPDGREYRFPSNQYTETQAIQEVRRMRGEEVNEGAGGDLGSLLTSGVGSLISSVGSGLDFVGLDPVGAPLQESGQRLSRRASTRFSPELARDLDQEGVQLGDIYSAVVQSAPSTAAIMGPGVGLGLASRAPGMSGLAGLARPLSSGLEGFQAAGGASLSIEEGVRAMAAERPQDFIASEIGREALREAEGDYGRAVEIAAERANGLWPALVGAFTGVVGRMGVDPAALLGRAGNQAAANFVLNVGRRALQEGAEETIQSAGETLGTNLALGGIDPQVGLFDNLADSMILGGIAGGVGGGAFGTAEYGMNALNRRFMQQQAPQEPVATPATDALNQMYDEEEGEPEPPPVIPPTIAQPEAEREPTQAVPEDDEDLDPVAEAAFNLQTVYEDGSDQEVSTAAGDLINAMANAGIPPERIDAAMRAAYEDGSPEALIALAESVATARTPDSVPDAEPEAESQAAEPTQEDGADVVEQIQDEPPVVQEQPAPTRSLDFIEQAFNDREAAIAANDDDAYQDAQLRLEEAATTLGPEYSAQYQERARAAEDPDALAELEFNLANDIETYLRSQGRLTPAEQVATEEREPPATPVDIGEPATEPTTEAEATAEPVEPELASPDVQAAPTPITPEQVRSELGAIEEPEEFDARVAELGWTPEQLKAAKAALPTIDTVRGPMPRDAEAAQILNDAIAAARKAQRKAAAPGKPKAAASLGVASQAAEPVAVSEKQSTPAAPKVKAVSAEVASRLRNYGGKLRRNLKNYKADTLSETLRAVNDARRELGETIIGPATRTPSNFESRAEWLASEADRLMSREEAQPEPDKLPEDKIRDALADKQLWEEDPERAALVEREMAKPARKKKKTVEEESEGIAPQPPSDTPATEEVRGEDAKTPAADEVEASAEQGAAQEENAPSMQEQLTERIKDIDITVPRPSEDYDTPSATDLRLIDEMAEAAATKRGTPYKDPTIRAQRQGMRAFEIGNERGFDALVDAINAIEGVFDRVRAAKFTARMLGPDQIEELRERIYGLRAVNRYLEESGDTLFGGLYMSSGMKGVNSGQLFMSGRRTMTVEFAGPNVKDGTLKELREVQKKIGNWDGKLDEEGGNRGEIAANIRANAARIRKVLAQAFKEDKKYFSEQWGQGYDSPVKMLDAELAADEISEDGLVIVESIIQDFDDAMAQGGQLFMSSETPRLPPESLLPGVKPRDKVALKWPWESAAYEVRLRNGLFTVAEPQRSGVKTMQEREMLVRFMRETLLPAMSKIHDDMRPSNFWLVSENSPVRKERERKIADIEAQYRNMFQFVMETVNRDMTFEMRAQMLRRDNGWLQDMVDAGVLDARVADDIFSGAASNIYGPTNWREYSGRDSGPIPVYNYTYQDRKQKLAARLAQYAKQMGVGDIMTRVVDVVRDPDSRAPIEDASAAYASRLLVISMGGDGFTGGRSLNDMSLDEAWQWVKFRADHELIHAMRQLGVIKDLEWKILENFARTHGIGVDGTKVVPSKEASFRDVVESDPLYQRELSRFPKADRALIVAEESVAMAFQNLQRMAPSRAKTLLGKIGRVIRVIQRALRIVNLNKPEDLYANAMDIVGYMNDGKVTNRPRDYVYGAETSATAVVERMKAIGTRSLFMGKGGKMRWGADIFHRIFKERLLRPETYLRTEGPEEGVSPMDLARVKRWNESLNRPRLELLRWAQVAAINAREIEQMIEATNGIMSNDDHLRMVRLQHDMADAQYMADQIINALGDAFWNDQYLQAIYLSIKTYQKPFEEVTADEMESVFKYMFPDDGTPDKPNNYLFMSSNNIRPNAVGPMLGQAPARQYELNPLMMYSQAEKDALRFPEERSTRKHMVNWLSRRVRKQELEFIDIAAFEKAGPTGNPLRDKATRQELLDWIKQRKLKMTVQYYYGRGDDPAAKFAAMTSDTSPYRYATRDERDWADFPPAASYTSYTLLGSDESLNNNYIEVAAKIMEGPGSDYNEAHFGGPGTVWGFLANDLPVNIDGQEINAFLINQGQSDLHDSDGSQDEEAYKAMNRIALALYDEWKADYVKKNALTLLANSTYKYRNEAGDEVVLTDWFADHWGAEDVNQAFGDPYDLNRRNFREFFQQQRDALKYGVNRFNDYYEKARTGARGYEYDVDMEELEEQKRAHIAAHEYWMNTIAEAERRFAEWARKNPPPPRPPLANEWPEAMFRHAFMMALSSGHDALAWVSGDTVRSYTGHATYKGDFYDKRWPAYAKKWLGPYGASVKEIDYKQNVRKKAGMDDPADVMDADAQLIDLAIAEVRAPWIAMNGAGMLDYNRLVWAEDESLGPMDQRPFRPDTLGQLIHDEIFHSVMRGDLDQGIGPVVQAVYDAVEAAGVEVRKYLDDETARPLDRDIPLQIRSYTTKVALNVREKLDAQAKVKRSTKIYVMRITPDMRSHFLNTGAQLFMSGRGPHTVVPGAPPVRGFMGNLPATAAGFAAARKPGDSFIGQQPRERVKRIMELTQAHAQPKHWSKRTARQLTTMLANYGGKLERDKPYLSSSGWLGRTIKQFAYGMTTLGNLPGQGYYLTLRSQLMGDINAGIDHAERLSKLSEKMKPEDFDQFGEYMLTRDAKPEIIINPDVREAAIISKQLFERFGAENVRIGRMDERQFEKYQGRYLPRKYFRYIENSLRTTGIRLGGEGYLKQRLKGQDKQIFGALDLAGYTVEVEKLRSDLVKVLDGASDRDATRAGMYLAGKLRTARTINEAALRKEVTRIRKRLREIERHVDSLDLISLAPDFPRGKDKNQYGPYMMKKRYGDNYVARAFFRAAKRGTSIGSVLEQSSVDAQITDPVVLSATGLAEQNRDLAVYHFFMTLEAFQNEARKIDPEVPDLKWILPGQLIEWQGRTMTSDALADQLNEARKNFHLNQNPMMRKYAEEQIAAMQELVERYKIQDIGDEYKRLPNSAAYGPLRGLIVHRAIYNDLKGTLGLTQAPDESPIAGINQAMGSFMSFFKQAMTTLNIPKGHTRALFQNAATMYFSGVGGHDLGLFVPSLNIQTWRWFFKSLEYMNSNHDLWKLSQELGGRTGTFTTTELRHAHGLVRRLKIDERMKSGDAAAQVQAIMDFMNAAKDAAADVFNFWDTWARFTKFVHEVEAKGAAPGDAMIEANEWAPDYSLVPDWVRALRSTFIPFLCVDDKTEILTQRGWLTQAEVREGDMAASYDLSTRTLKWKEIDNIYRAHKTGEMIHVVDRHLDMFMTPDHRCVVKRRQGDQDPFIVQAQNLSTSHKIPTAADFEHHPVGEPLSDEMVELLGWYVTEGHDHPKCAAVVITQNDGPKAQRIADLLERMHISCNVQSGYNKVNFNASKSFYIPAKIGRGLREMAPNKQLPAATIMRMTKAQIGILVGTMILGDGYINPDDGRACFIQKDNETSRSFMMALTILGKSYNAIPKDGDMLHITVREGRDYCVRRAKRERVDYDGMIWCPHVKDTHTWVARRNGKPFITHNTFQYKLGPKFVDQLSRMLGHMKRGEIADAGNIALRFAAPMMLWTGTMSMLSASLLGMDEEEHRSLRASMSKFFRQNPGTIPVPLRDSNGRIVLVDIGIMYPWTQHVRASGSLSRGEIFNAATDMGLGIPAADIWAAWTNGIDPYTGFPLYPETATEGEKNIAHFAFMINYVTPPPLRGLTDPLVAALTGQRAQLGGGELARSLDAMVGDGMTVSGKPIEDPVYLAARVVTGFNFNTHEPRDQASRNIRQMEYEASELDRQRNQAIRDYARRIRAIRARTDIDDRRKDAMVAERRRAHMQYLDNLRERQRRLRDRLRTYRQDVAPIRRFEAEQNED